MDIKGIIALMRPKQWIKNFFVFAAIIFSGNLTNESILKNNIITFILFCLTSSTIYILNDIVDLEKDKKHPEKKNRPLPSGRVSKSTAIIMNIVILFTVLFCSYKFVDYKIMYIYLLYIVMNIFYCFKLKNVVILDVMVITFGFVLRMESGSLATKVSVSPWLFLCTILLSLFLALNKRKSEIITLKDNRGSHRKILEEYSVELIDNMLTIVTPSILISYCIYTFSSVQSKRMMYTIPFVLYGIFRYQYLMNNHNLGGKPEDVFGKDKPFLVNMVLWVISVVVIIYFKL
ncbi:decaprenyl-phosphate phosphoribosyltransferase [Clostridium botulinum]|uniref:Prenyltransferase, UbiA family n=1 Tax=Clostridium botulinum (strain Okra / Type B1) TaxID=498213 RepID=B1II32_CLOBK|nr:decaprenyl-phosphate phosphoribosyltransferase [Clostridium botulinum]EKX80652.1 phosphoribose diphosphate:decaprenyl-phosphate phosphoribosyltransferase [Clostridium botulinum CFSAN001628]ACA45899.1 prenyltransferase, UbiA family [Clostridium botulinum B1 str. Okra]MBD5564122.1 decaprenyl-phosphate phosphoribosyltransferase [Clostridium botulinum]MBD5566771.1 decaprenyl-phosphate phosphoribosyltransferase [Clostridium botulinum]MBD5568713.1 decaprenyl-phosphate phosphoribosyltransferase [C